MNLIPFAKSVETNLLVDVADVQSGQKCGCVCPSCDLPLIAKKGEINEWHFAHDSKFIEKDQELSCDFSWTVAVKMMIKQLLMEGSQLVLPDYYMDFQGVGYQAIKRQIKVTDSSSISYNNPVLKSLECDIVVEVLGKKLGILLVNKYVPSTDETSFEQSLLGVLAISIERIGFDNEGKAVNHLRHYLKQVLESQTNAKYWLYHKREKAAYLKAAAEDKLNKNTEVLNKPEHPENVIRELIQSRPKFTQTLSAKPVPTLIKRHWHCLQCKIDYQGYTTGENPCPQCQSHFYRV